MPSIHEVARLAGVSTGTVSRALTGKPDISEAARKRVIKVVKEVGYVPRGPKANTRQIAIPVSLQFCLRDGYFAWFLEGMHNAAFRRGYDVVLLPFDRTEYTADDLLMHLLGRGIRGLVQSYFLPLPETLRALVASGIQVVTTYDERQTLPEVGVVTYDYYDAFYRALMLLLEHGFRDLYLVYEDPRIDQSGQARVRAYEDLVRECGLEPHRIDVTGISVDKQLPVFMRLIEEREGKPYGIMGVYPWFIPAFYRAHDVLGVSPLNRAGLIATDDFEYLSFLSPPVSAIASPVREMGSQAVELMAEMLEGQPARKIVLPTKIEIRRSSNAVA